jgi:hypothetical protein
MSERAIWGIIFTYAECAVTVNLEFERSTRVQPLFSGKNLSLLSIAECGLTAISERKKDIQ